MIFSPLNGYLGDRINRKNQLILSITIWLVSVIAGSYMTSNLFGLFVLFRCLFGAATASFGTIAVPILGDTFKANQRGRDFALIVFNLGYFKLVLFSLNYRTFFHLNNISGAPLGTGFSYLIGLTAKELEPNDWRFTMRFTPIFLTLVLILVLIAYKEPKRELNNLVADVEIKRSFGTDLKALLQNKTFVLLTLSWSCCLSSLGLIFLLF